MVNGMEDRSKKAIGAFGEQKAVEYLLGCHCQVLKTNFRVGRIGEIDIIARDGEYICFIEVKTRRTTNYGSPGEAVIFSKQQKIHRIAAIYLANPVLSDSCVRFDIIEIMIDDKKDQLAIKSIHHIKNAF